MWMDQAATEFEPSTKKRGVGAAQKDHMQLLLDNTRQNLANAQAIRALSAAVYTSVQVKADMLAVKKAHAATKAFNERTRGVSGHRLGSPHVQAWRAFIQGTIEEHDKSDKKEENAVNLLRKHLDDMQAGPQAVAQMIKMFRVKDCFDEEHSNVTLAIFPLLKLGQNSGQAVFEALMHVLTQTFGAELHQGQAPPTRLERKLQAQLKQLEGEASSQAKPVK
eukprot:TRINITY_DN39523_c0_g1_i1.p2 TRINITY_DN39523_c0_g1~~TRINITY_DN39523_c0_g1_i1.p2  ORF type:complete len:255 (+),score=52.43 TRINITY_DN39523_c0_g1_i1:103-765(+)